MDAFLDALGLIPYAHHRVASTRRSRLSQGSDARRKWYVSPPPPLPPSTLGGDSLHWDPTR